MLITRNIKLVIEYDGTNYGGWQRQKNCVTIQETLEKAIGYITGEKADVTGCSRTDAGVHAREFVCNFYTASRIPEEKYADAVNSRLPSDIVILKSMEVAETFHSRYSSIGKTYSYTILNRRVPSAIERNFMYHYKQSLDVERMKKAAENIIGRHDFSAFRNLGSSVKTSVRNVSHLYIRKDDDIIKIFATADGFLYNMVRIITGTLLEVGIGKLEPHKVRDILLSKDRSLAGPSVPPQGLCLEKVYY